MAAAVAERAAAVEPVATRSETLDCGMRVVAVQLPHHEFATVQLWFHAGAADDPADAPGLTSTAFRGLSDAAIYYGDDESSVGGLYSTQDVCGAVWTCRTVELRDTLRGTLTVFEVDPDNLIPMQSLSRPPPMRTLSSGDYAWSMLHFERILEPFREQIWRSAFGSEFDYARQIEREVKVEEYRERLARQHRAEFVAANATLIITAPDSPESVLRVAREQLRDLPAASRIRKPWRGRPRFHGGLGPPIHGDIEGVALAWPTPRFANVELAAFDVLGHYLVNPVDGAVGATPVCAPAKRYFSAEAGLFVLQLPPVIPRSARSAPALSEADALCAAAPVIEALAKLASSAPDAVRLQRARALAAARVRVNRDSMVSEAMEYGLADVLGGDVHLAEFEALNIAEVTAADLQSLARSLLGTLPLIHPLFESAQSRLALTMREWVDSLRFHDFMSQIGCADHADQATCGHSCGFTVCGEAAQWKLFAALAPIGETRIRIEFGAPINPDDGKRLLDYSSFHGKLTYADAPTAGIWTIRGTSERLPAMVEQILKLQPSAASESAPPTLRVESRMSPEELVASLRAIGIVVTAADR